MGLNINPVKLYCPNCGCKLTGFMRDDGALKIQCTRCKANIFSKQKSKREINLKISSN